MKNKASSL